MSPTHRTLIGVGLMALLMAGVAASLLGGRPGVYYLTLEEFVARPIDRAVRLAGFVMEGSIEKDAAGLAVSFVLRDEAGGRRLPVRFDARATGGRIPAAFTDGAQVVVAGAPGAGGVFVANQILAKCPSKYDAASQRQTGRSGP